MTTETYTCEECGVGLPTLGEAVQHGHQHTIVDIRPRHALPTVRAMEAYDVDCGGSCSASGVPMHAVVYYRGDILCDCPARTETCRHKRAVLAYKNQHPAPLAAPTTPGTRDNTPAGGDSTARPRGEERAADGRRGPRSELARLVDVGQRILADEDSAAALVLARIRQNYDGLAAQIAFAQQDQKGQRIKAGARRNPYLVQSVSEGNW